MPLDAPVTIATLFDSLLIFTIVLDPTPRTPNVHRCELRLARMKISIYSPYAKERFEAARQQTIGLMPARSPTACAATSCRNATWHPPHSDRRRTLGCRHLLVRQMAHSTN